MKIFCCFTLVLTLVGCGKFSRLHSGETSVTFNVSGGHGLTASLPGIMVYAMRVNDGASKGAIYLPSETALVSWAVPNGNYNFYAFGYTGAGMTGTMYCGSVPNVSLTGGTTAVNLVIDDNFVCGTPPFSPTGFGASGGSAPLPLKIAACDAANGGFASIAPPSLGCDASGGRPTGASIASVRLSLPEFVRWDPAQEVAGKGPGLVSACIDGPFTGVGVVTGLNIPAGPFPFLLETYSAASCATFMGAYTFGSGIMAAQDNQSIRFIDASNTRVFPAIQMAYPTYATSISSYLFVRVY